MTELEPIRTGRRYRKAPVVEALFEAFLLRPADPLVAGRLYEKLKAEFPTAEQKQVYEAEFVLGGRGEATAGLRTREPRSVFRSRDGLRLVQCGVDVLVVNQLAPPYPGFDAWRPTVSASLAALEEIVPGVRFRQIGLRYINRIGLPGPAIVMEDYFELYPRLPARLGSRHGDYLVHLKVPKDPHLVIASLGSAPPRTPGENAHVLDIYDILAVEGGGLTVTDAEREIAVAHANIEIAFEAAIADKLRASFEPESGGD